MADEFGEKTERATPRRREQLREQGNIPKSTDLAGVMTVAGTLLPLFFFGSMIIERWMGLMDYMLGGRSIGSIESTDSIFADLGLAFKTAFVLAAPFLILSFLATALTLGVQVGLNVTPEPLIPRLSKLNPIQGVKKLFDVRSIARFLSSIAKVILAIGVAIVFFWMHYREVVILPRMDLAAGVMHSADLVMQLSIWLLIVMIILGLIDVAYQKWQWERDNRMSKEEIKEETKNTLGDPKIKKRQREFAMKIMNQRTSQIVPQADVVVTNPEHISIALKWDPETMNAPRVLAKGADYLALRIRQIAIMHGIPIVERKPLARAMYPVVEPGHEIPPQFYAAVAEILAYVYRLEGRLVG